MESPYHNVSKTLNLFWTQWRDKVLTSEAGAEMEVEEFVEGTSLKATRFDKLCSQLFTKAKEFLSLRAFEARDVLGELMFSRAVLERDSELETSLYWAKKTEGFLKKLPTSPEKALAQLYHQLQTTEAKIADRKHPPKFAEDFSNMLNNLDFFGQVKELQLTVAAENIRQIFQQKGKAQEEFLPGRIENLLEHRICASNPFLNVKSPSPPYCNLAPCAPDFEHSPDSCRQTYCAESNADGKRVHQTL